MLVTRGFMLPTGKPAAGRLIEVYTPEGVFVSSGTTDALGNLVIDLEAGLYTLQVDGFEIDFEVQAIPGVVQPSVADRIAFTHVVPAVTPFEFTAPSNQHLQFSITGGAGVAVLISPGSGSPFTTFVGGTGTAPILGPGESIRVSWGATAPTAIRSRVFLQGV